MAGPYEVKAAISVIDDNEAMQEWVRDILESQGYRVYQTTRALDGIALVKTVRPDLILMGFELPEPNGLPAVKVLKSDRAASDIPVAAFTSFDAEADREAARQAVCVAYIAKPFHVDAVLETVAALLRQLAPLTRKTGSSGYRHPLPGTPSLRARADPHE
ncbi:MAG TPA: response regulator [Patescibacteria group bacterium]|nr:response regulator [Patescibacteria group bacterium]